MRFLIGLVLTVGFLGHPESAAWGSEENPATAILAGRLVDSGNGTVLENQVITVRNGIIESVSPGMHPPENATVIDLSDMTVLPGLVDAHTHLAASSVDPDPTSEIKVTAAQRALMKAQGVYLIPTLSVQDCVNLENDFPEEFVNRAHTVMDSARASFREAVEDGVKVALGSDVPVCAPGSNAREFDWMVRHGMAPMQAIQAATINGADLLGLSDRIGRIEVGMFADIVGVRGDPLENIRLLEDVQFVMKHGVVHKHQ